MAQVIARRDRLVEGNWEDAYHIFCKGLRIMMNSFQTMLWSSVWPIQQMLVNKSEASPSVRGLAPFERQRSAIPSNDRQHYLMIH